MNPEIIYRYFPQLTPRQREQIEALGPLYADWNSKINVISRKDIDNLYEHHVLHSLAIAKFMTPVQDTRFIDLGCGGGFPGIPLAIMWPDVTFHLIDRTGKKIKVATEVAQAIGLTNVTLQHGDAAECHRKFDFVVSRAVMRLDELVRLSRRLIAPRGRNKWPNGLVCLKGGELAAEMSAGAPNALDVPLSDYFTDDYFATKSLVYVPL
ncbi:MAG: 16S rRNA (guanine(527)-N(7))-methyltransferase RsmG [Candidatus Amulumruptor caecigallinarius]|nr:16S rRNA (guanine(527)-N(7))-methyltransferase RsmG [Candidatus Amulumruptor caecigallinarius]MCM1395970.1 16S rRNA (guanine(527)-N(7))-methyltransferase RsmG [Candidatus Amulumruptor caecigallinarius]